MNNTSISSNSRPELPFNPVKRKLFISEAGEESVANQIATIVQVRSIQTSIKYQNTTTITRSDELHEQVEKLYI